jgi:hypothetical protein
MTELKRWQDDGAPPEFRSMFQAVRSEHPSNASLERALEAAGLAAVATQTVARGALSASTTSGGIAANGGLLSLTTKIVAVSLLGAAAVALTLGVVSHRRANSARTVAESAATMPARLTSNDAAFPVASATGTRIAIVDPSALPLIPTGARAGSASSQHRSVHDASPKDGNASLATSTARELVERFPNAPNAGRARELLQSRRQGE